MNPLLRLSFCTTLITLCLSSTVWAEPATPPVAKLSVRGEAQLMVPPDQVSVVLGVTTESSKAKKAITDNSQKMTKVIDALARLGIKKDSYKTQNFRVQPIWSVRPKDANKNWRASIVSYRVNNSLHVTTKALSRIGDVIAGATEAGANQVNSVNFSLSDERQYRSQAITQAMGNAKQDANVLVAASGDRIKRTLSLNLDNTSASRVRVEALQSSARFKSALADAPPPISSGDITVRASVSVVYELQSP